MLVQRALSDSAILWHASREAVTLPTCLPEGGVLPRVSPTAGIARLHARGAILGRNGRPIRARVPRTWESCLLSRTVCICRLKLIAVHHQGSGCGERKDEYEPVGMEKQTCTRKLWAYEGRSGCT
jgi:hypothetical protein